VGNVLSQIPNNTWLGKKGLNLDESGENIPEAVIIASKTPRGGRERDE